MEPLLEQLLGSYENGKCNRRELLAALGALLATQRAQAAASSKLPVRCRELNHVTLRVKDLGESKQFYTRLIGLPVINEDKEVCRLGLGRGFLVLRKSSDVGLDHWCVGVQPFTRARAEADHGSRDGIRDLIRREGFALRQDPDDPTIYVRDPDGLVVQLEAPGFEA